jgi:segregation and condensation protein A
MKFVLDVFEGPLDLLLYLIKKNEIDIHDIPIAEITSQYLAHIELMKLLNLNVAGEFLVMASALIYIKTKLLIPREQLSEDDIDVDPRRELVEQLVEYQKYKEIAEQLAAKEKERHDIFTRPEGEWDAITQGEAGISEVSLRELFSAFSNVLDIVMEKGPELIEPEKITVEDKIREILERLRREDKFTLKGLCSDIKNKIDLIVTFIAILELARLSELVVRQETAFGEIFIEKTSRGVSEWKNLN